jgi:von Willebrand factor type A domain
MRHQPPTLSLALICFISIVFTASILYSHTNVTSQTPNKNFNANGGRPSRKAIQLPARPTPTPTPESDAEVVKIDVDLVKVDALVMQKNTARIVGGLKKEDFLIYEDGTKQEITHFSQDKLPLSVILVIDRGECLDPYGDEVHRAAREAIDRLKLVDEIAVMAYANTSVLIQPFTTNRIQLENSLQRIPPQAGNVEHCLNNMFADAANYMIKASNPSGRRVVIVVTGVTRLFDCADGPSGN